MTVALSLPGMPGQDTRKHAALRLTRQILEASDVLDSMPVDIRRLARYLGVARFHKTALRSADAVLLPGRNGHTILLKDQSCRHRERFSIAHEIGHIILRANGIRFRGGSRKRSAQEERLCDSIASELLMPASQFGPLVDRLPPTIEGIEQLSDAFDTSIEATARRFSDFCSRDLELVMWHRNRSELKASWVAGPRFVSRGSTRPLSHLTVGPVLAYHSDETIWTYETGKRSASLTLQCESKGYAQSKRFVLGVIREDPLLQPSNEVVE